MGDLPGGVFSLYIQCLIPDGRPTLHREEPISFRATPIVYWYHLPTVAGTRRVNDPVLRARRSPILSGLCASEHSPNPARWADATTQYPFSQTCITMG